MKKKFTLVTLCVIFLINFANSDERGQTLVQFSIEDQFGIIHTDKEYQNRVTIMFGSDRNGEQYSKLWGEAIHDSLKGHPHYDPVLFTRIADLRGVPVMFKSIVKNMLSKKKPILMDWENVLGFTYNFKSEHANICIFTKNAKLLYSISVKKINSDEMSTLIVKLRNELNLKNE